MLPVAHTRHGLIHHFHKLVPAFCNRWSQHVSISCAWVAQFVFQFCSLLEVYVPYSFHSSYVALAGILESSPFVLHISAILR